jgi:hypothetical protein
MSRQEEVIPMLAAFGPGAGLATKRLISLTLRTRSPLLQSLETQRLMTLGTVLILEAYYSEL